MIQSLNNQNTALVYTMIYLSCGTLRDSIGDHRGFKILFGVEGFYRGAGVVSGFRVNIGALIIRMGVLGPAVP